MLKVFPKNIIFKNISKKCIRVPRSNVSFLYKCTSELNVQNVFFSKKYLKSMFLRNNFLWLSYVFFAPLPMPNSFKSSKGDIQHRIPYRTSLKTLIGLTIIVFYSLVMTL